MKIDYLLSLLPPAEIHKIGGRWRDFSYTSPSSRENPDIHRKAKSPRSGRAIERIRRVRPLPESGEYYGLRLYMKDGTAHEIWENQVLDRFEPNWRFFWPDSKRDLVASLQALKKNVVASISMSALSSKAWSTFRTVKVEPKDQRLTISMAGVDGKGGDRYSMSVAQIVADSIDDGGRALPRRKIPRITRASVSRRRDSIRVVMTDGREVTLTPHDVLSVCDYRYEGFKRPELL